MRVLALDQSETSTGYAVWGEGDARALTGWKTLGSEFTSPGRVFANIHQLMTELNELGTIDVVFYERPRHLDGWNAQSNANAHMLLVGLAAHILSWGTAMQCRMVRDAHMSTWRAHFLHGMARPRNPDGSKIDGVLKVMAVDRCKALGIKTQRHDEAEAFGILDHACDVLGLAPPWLNPAVNPLHRRADTLLVLA